MRKDDGQGQAIGTPVLRAHSFWSAVRGSTRAARRAGNQAAAAAMPARRAAAWTILVAGVPDDPDDLDLAPLLQLESESPAHCIVGPEQLRRGGGIDHRDARRVPVVARLEAASREQRLSPSCRRSRGTPSSCAWRRPGQGQGEHPAGGGEEEALGHELTYQTSARSADRHADRHHHRRERLEVAQHFGCYIGGSGGVGSPSRDRGTTSPVAAPSSPVEIVMSPLTVNSSRSAPLSSSPRNAARPRCFLSCRSLVRGSVFWFSFSPPRGARRGTGSAPACRSAVCSKAGLPVAPRSVRQVGLVLAQLRLRHR